MQVSPLSQFQRRLFAWCMAGVNGIDQEAVKCIDCAEYDNMATLKHALLGKLTGTVVEIGPGAGANFVYYPKDIHWIGIEPNPFMHPYLQDEAARQGFHDIQFYGDSGEHLGLENESVDAVVSTHVLCSVGQLEAVFTEIIRVLKPGGTFTFFEHVGAAEGTWTRTLQNGITPVWKILFDGCYPNRDIWNVLATTGFTAIDYEAFQLKLPVVGPHIAGVAVK
ncbi:MAG: class I SAM-dependent methyltransferase [Leptolyngbyaceae bacterium]|nr:class I SAM-dependent methyltransferase [Leptolyngbyaceae bacterium]